MKLILVDPVNTRDNLLPLTYTRPVADLRVGIDTIAEKWARLLSAECVFAPAADYLRDIFPSDEEGGVAVPGNIIPTPELVANFDAMDWSGAMKIENIYDIFMLNGECIRADFKHITAGRNSQPISATNTVVGDASQIFIEAGAVVEGAFLNTTKGPIYIGKDAEVMEGSMLRGPIAICEHAVVNMGTKIYPDTTIGPYCKVGGEINNVVFHSYSNKAHDGFLGNAVIGQWCNLGAGCVASNLKNDYTPIRLWNYPTRRFLRTTLQFCGLVMGDHSKAGINTMFNTATVVGVGCNIHGSGFPRNFVSSFSEGSTAGFTEVSLNKFFDIAERVMARRGKQLSAAERRMFETIHDLSDSFK